MSASGLLGEIKKFVKTGLCEYWANQLYASCQILANFYYYYMSVLLVLWLLSFDY